MHELSLALEICRVVEAQLTPVQLPQLIALGVEVGEAAGIEVANLAFCLDTLLMHPPFAGATLEITHAPGDDLRVAYLALDDERVGQEAA